MYLGRSTKALFNIKRLLKQIGKKLYTAFLSLCINRGLNCGQKE